MKQIKFVSVRPDGTVCGPVGDDFETVQMLLIAAWKKTMLAGAEITDKLAWEQICESGYTIRKAKIQLLRWGGYK